MKIPSLTAVITIFGIEACMAVVAAVWYLILEKNFMTHSDLRDAPEARAAVADSDRPMSSADSAQEAPVIPCSICFLPIDVVSFPGSGVVWRDGHNAAPVNSGRCCSKCNDNVVIPARLAILYSGSRGSM